MSRAFTEWNTTARGSGGKDGHRETETDRKRKVEAGGLGERWRDMEAVATAISVCAPFIWQQIRETCHI